MRSSNTMLTTEVEHHIIITEFTLMHLTLIRVREGEQ